MNYFEDNPIKITKITVNNTEITNHIYILIGNVSSIIKHEIQKKPTTSNILKKKYGSTWKKKLGLDLLLGSTKGGDDKEEYYEEEELISSDVISEDIEQDIINQYNIDTEFNLIDCLKCFLASLNFPTDT